MMEGVLHEDEPELVTLDKVPAEELQPASAKVMRAAGLLHEPSRLRGEHWETNALLQWRTQEGCPRRVLLRTLWIERPSW